MNNVKILSANTMIRDIEMKQSNFAIMDHAKESIARLIGMELLRSDMIEFRNIENNDISSPYFKTTEVVGKVGIASKYDFINVLEERQKLRIEGADILASEIKKQVALLGSYYGREFIEKHKVNSIIDEAIRKVIDR